MPVQRRQSGFTLVEMITVLVIVGILGTVALGKFRDLGDSAENAKLDAINATISNYLNTINGMRYTLAGKPPNATYVDIDGINMRFRNGLVRQVQDSNHVPVGTPNRNNQATRFWFMIFETPPPVIARTDTSSKGWAMYNGAAQCGVTRSRCWNGAAVRC